MNTRNKLFIITLISLILPSLLIGHQLEARTDQIFDTSNNNLKLSLVAPDSWNSGTISQTITKLNWRLNGLTVSNDDLSALFAVVNLPSLANMALPLGEKTGILSLIIGHYVTIKGESDIKLSDGSNAHRFSIAVTTQQLKNLKAPLDTGFDAVLLTTNQQGGSYLIIYAAQQGRLGEFRAALENILSSVKFDSVGFSISDLGFTNDEDKSNPNNTKPQSNK